MTDLESFGAPPCRAGFEIDDKGECFFRRRASNDCGLRAGMHGYVGSFKLVSGNLVPNVVNSLVGRCTGIASLSARSCELGKDQPSCTSYDRL